MKRKQQSAGNLSRRQILKYGLYGGLSAGLPASLWLSGCGKQWAGKKPNVIIIVVDTLRADHVGCYDYQRNTTPNIDALARKGILFRNVISSSSWTLPSIATLLTSQYPCVLGIRDTAVIDSRFPPLSQVLKQHNYTTHGIISHLLVSARLGFGRGFDEYKEWRSALAVHQGVSSPMVTREAISFLQRSHDKPFFLFTHYFDPHWNYVLHPKYNYYPLYKGSLGSGESLLSLRKRRHNLSEDDMQQLLALYDSEIAFTDEHIGKLIDELKKQGLYDDSIIIVTSDHGEEFMERGWLGHSTTLHQELLHVPLIIKLPNALPGVVEPCVGLIDIMPTLLDYLDLDIPDGLEGKPLNLTHPDSIITTTPIFSETFKAVIIPPAGLESVGFRSIILSDWKFIHDVKKDSKQMYNLSEDPHERNNLLGRHNQQEKKLEALLLKWVNYTIAKQKTSPTKNQDELFTPEQRKQLESLGYI